MNVCKNVGMLSVYKCMCTHVWTYVCECICGHVYEHVCIICMGVSVSVCVLGMCLGVCVCLGCVWACVQAYVLGMSVGVCACVAM